VTTVFHGDEFKPGRLRRVATDPVHEIKGLSNVFLISGRLQEIAHAKDEFVPLNDEQIGQFTSDRWRK